MKAQRSFKGLVVLLTLIIAFAMLSCAPDAEVPLEITDNYVPDPPRVEIIGRILIITDQDFNDTELFYPLYRFVEEGYDVTVATLEGGAVVGYNTAHLPLTTHIDIIEPEYYQALYLPGGEAPQTLRRDERVLNVVRHFAEEGKPIGAICHGPQILISAGLVEGRQMASWAGMSDELIAAGAEFINEATVIDDNFITARKPGDLPTHVHHFLQMLQ